MADQIQFPCTRNYFLFKPKSKGKNKNFPPELSSLHCVMARTTDYGRPISFFSLKSRCFGLGQTYWADKFWGIWGIFCQTISIHFGTVSPGNDLLCKVHNPLKRLFGHEKNRQSADYRSRYRFF